MAEHPHIAALVLARGTFRKYAENHREQGYSLIAERDRLPGGSTHGQWDMLSKRITEKQERATVNDKLAQSMTDAIDTIVPTRAVNGIDIDLFAHVLGALETQSNLLERNIMGRDPSPPEPGSLIGRAQEALNAAKIARDLGAAAASAVPSDYEHMAISLERLAEERQASPWAKNQGATTAIGLLMLGQAAMMKTLARFARDYDPSLTVHLDPMLPADLKDRIMDAADAEDDAQKPFEVRKRTTKASAGCMWKRWYGRAAGAEYGPREFDQATDTRVILRDGRIKTDSVRNLNWVRRSDDDPHRVHDIMFYEGLIGRGEPA